MKQHLEDKSLDRVACEKANEITQWLQDAVGDIAYTCEPDEEWKVKIANAKREGVQNIKDWLADEYYNDVDTLQDLCGDRIFYAAYEMCRASSNPKDPSYDQHFIAIAEKMKENAHTTLIMALDRLIARRQK